MLSLRLVVELEISWCQHEVDLGIAISEEIANLMSWKQHRVNVNKKPAIKPVK
ncbi:tail fiber assembly protein [Kluyvera sichuanensis]